MPETEPDDNAEPTEQASNGSFVSEHPVAIGMLVVAMIAGACVSFVYLSHTLSPTRSVLGGALVGFGCWMLVMFGQLIDD